MKATAFLALLVLGILVMVVLPTAWFGRRVRKEILAVPHVRSVQFVSKQQALGAVQQGVGMLDAVEQFEARTEGLWGGDPLVQFRTQAIGGVDRLPGRERPARRNVRHRSRGACRETERPCRR